jgi:hypothetical protein
VINANSKIIKEIEKCKIEKQYSHTRHQDLSGSAQQAYIHWRRRSRRNLLTKEWNTKCGTNKTTQTQKFQHTQISQTHNKELNIKKNTSL